ncbi:hypothetical protein BDZ89DRAFT_1105272 [Hymenopellis radicata]|nr:hypothetical protein BDZ89DRAFT_1105272 [Hymenopellis radicata]
MVNKFGEGRVVVAGDAAHVHSPSGGQGLNTGVQDAFNLAWKLSHVIKHLSAPSLLDSYTAERLPVVASMLAETTAVLDTTYKDAIKGYDRGWELRQFGVNYRGSDIVLDDGDKSEVADPYRSGDDGRARGGDRAPDAPGLLTKDGTRTSVYALLNPTRHTVLVFGASANDEAFRVNYPEEVVSVVSVYPRDTLNGVLEVGCVIDADGHAYEGCAILQVEAVIVRPDGVIGARVRDAHGIRKYFRKILL